MDPNEAICATLVIVVAFAIIRSLIALVMYAKGEKIDHVPFFEVLMGDETVEAWIKAPGPLGIILDILVVALLALIIMMTTAGGLVPFFAIWGTVSLIFGIGYTAKTIRRRNLR